MQNPFEPNITFEIEEISNPFTPTTLGEGGLNSGAKLTNYITTDEFKNKDARVKKHNLNAQRLYRQRNRKYYNDYMKQLWIKHKDNSNPNDKDDKYTNWKKNQAIANQNYRLKKLMKNPPEKTIERALRKEFRENTPKKAGRRKKGEKTYQEKEEDYINDTQNIASMKEKLKSDYEKKYEKLLADNPFTPTGKKRNLSKEPVYVVGEYEYKQYDPTGLQIASKTRPKNTDLNTKLQHNLKELKDYYESVITDIRPEENIPKEWEKGRSRFYPEAEGAQSKEGAKRLPTNFEQKRKKHKEAIESSYGVEGSKKIKTIRQGEKKKVEKDD